MRVRSYKYGAALVAALWACSGPDDEVPAGSAGSTQGGTGGSTSAAGAAGNAQSGSTTGGAATGGEVGAGGAGQSGSGGAAGSGGSEPAGPTGRIQLVSLYGPMFNRLSAEFSLPAQPSAPVPSAGDCTTLTSGACAQNTCAVAADVPAPTPTAQPHAGTIHFTSTDLADPTRIVTASAVPDTMGNYAPVELSSSLLGQEAMHFSAEGAEVPSFAFDMESPLRLLLTNPGLLVASDQATLTVSSTVDTVLTWDRGVAGVTFFVQGTAPNQSLTCSFDSAAGTGTIPAEITSQVVGMELLFTTLTSELVQAGDYTVRIVTAYDVMNPDRSAAVAGVVE